MEKRDKIKIGCGILFSIGIMFFLIRIYNALSTFDETLRAKEHSIAIEFKRVDQTIFITSRRWGLGGQHFHTVISTVDFASHNIPIDQEKDIVLDNRCGLYYKKQDPDSLFIFLPSNSYTEEREDYRQIGNINVKIMEVKNMTYSSFKNSYRMLGLIPLLCSDSIR